MPTRLPLSLQTVMKTPDTDREFVGLFLLMKTTLLYNEVIGLFASTTSLPTFHFVGLSIASSSTQKKQRLKEVDNESLAPRVAGLSKQSVGGPSSAGQDNDDLVNTG